MRILAIERKENQERGKNHIKAVTFTATHTKQVLANNNFVHVHYKSVCSEKYKTNRIHLEALSLNNHKRTTVVEAMNKQYKAFLLCGALP